jgi:hypothetical protein
MDSARNLNDMADLKGLYEDIGEKVTDLNQWILDL